MTGFVIGAALICVAALLVLLRPLMFKRSLAATTHGQTNAAVLRDQLAKLDDDLAAGLLSREDYDVSRQELQRRALHDIADTPAATNVRPARKTLVALAAVIPLVAAGVYAVLGEPGALREQAQGPHAPTQADIEGMVAGLAERMEREPGNLEGWVMLARSYKVLGRTVEAERAYDSAGTALDGNAQELAHYADVAATNAQGNFAGKPSQLIARALKADPQNPMALWLAGTAELQAGRNAEAVRIWERLIALLPPDSDDARELTAAVEHAKMQLKKAR